MHECIPKEQDGEEARRRLWKQLAIELLLQLCGFWNRAGSIACRHHSERSQEDGCSQVTKPLAFIGSGDSHWVVSLHALNHVPSSMTDGTPLTASLVTLKGQFIMMDITELKTLMAAQCPAAVVGRPCNKTATKDHIIIAQNYPKNEKVRPLG